MKNLDRIKKLERLVFVFGLFFLLGFLYLEIVLKYENIFVKALIASIFIILIFLSAKLRRLKNDLKQERKLIYRFGKKCHIGLYSGTSFFLGFLFLVTGIWSIFNGLITIINPTLGLLFIIQGLDNRVWYYIEISETKIIKSGFDSFRISKIDSIEHNDQLTTLRIGKRTMSIDHNVFPNNEIETFLSKLEIIKERNSLI